jgi:mRNA interferase MazF
MKKREIKQGDIYYCSLDIDAVESEQCGTRPVVVISCDTLSSNRSNVIIVPITSSKQKKHMINHYALDGGLYEELTSEHNIVLLECIRDISKSRLERKICTLSEYDLDCILNLIIYDFKEFPY